MRNSTEIKILIKYLARFLIVLVMLDILFGLILGLILEKQTKGNYAKFNKVFFDDCFDTMVVGNSRAERQFVSEILRDSLNKTVFNAGLGGRDIYFFNAVLDGLNQRCKPKTIILEFSWSDLKVPIKKDRVEFFAPYYNKLPQINSYIDENKIIDKILLQSALIRYNSTLWDLLSASLVDEEMKLGYRPLFGNLLVRKIEKKEKVEPILKQIPENLNWYKSFINKCQELNIKLILVNSPHYFDGAVFSQGSKQDFLDFLKKQKVQFITYENNKTFKQNQELFHDIRHLNDTGARIFTAQLAHKLKKIL